jgi:uncharacterized protein
MEPDEQLTAATLEIIDAPEPESGAERRCILTLASGPRAVLIRLAVGPDGQVAADLGGKLPGRGAWISADRSLFEAARLKGKLRGALARAFRNNALVISDDLGDRIADGLQRRAFDRLGLENRAGHLIWGFERVGDALLKGNVRMLLHVADAGADGVSKLEARRRGASPETISLTLPVGRQPLSVALGRENVVHAGIGNAGAAARVGEALAKWTGWLGLDPTTRTDAAPAASDDETGIAAQTAVAAGSLERH